MRKTLLLAPFCLSFPAVALAQTPFVNEFSYDCSTADDAGCEYVEIAVPTGASLSDYAVYFYNGNGGSVYDPLTGTNDASGTARTPLTSFGLGETNNGYTLYTYTIPTFLGTGGRFQNGAPDGFALVNTVTNTTIELFSYEGTTTPTNGPAVGATPIVVTPVMTNSTPSTQSISKTNDGWVLTTATPGSLNTNQTALPVELVSLTAVASGSDAVVRWTTASETNNASFAIEALRGSAWTELATVAGRGTTSERADYETRLSGLGTGRHTLRLVQRDVDGTATVAGTVEVAIGQTAAFDVAVRGNATAAPEVSFVSRESGAAVVTVSDVTGRTVARYAVDALAGARTGVTVADLAAGVYVVRLESARGTAASTLVVR